MMGQFLQTWILISVTILINIKHLLLQFYIYEIIHLIEYWRRDE